MENEQAVRENLRDIVARFSVSGIGDTVSQALALLDAKDAEIARLTEALALQTEQQAYPCSPHCAGYLREQEALSRVAKLEAGMDRMKREVVEALEKISGMIDGEQAWWARDIAHAALSKAKQENRDD